MINKKFRIVRYMGSSWAIQYVDWEWWVFKAWSFLRHGDLFMDQHSKLDLDIISFASEECAKVFMDCQFPDSEIIK